ncbi:MAG: hypothetical protein V4558_15250 [Gemmatimonadota bacterium]
MEPTTLPWLDSVIGVASAAAVALLVIVNGGFALGVMLLRDRSFVNRWTKPLVVADTILLATAVGAPVLGVAAKLGLKGLGLLSAVPAAATTAATTK